MFQSSTTLKELVQNLAKVIFLSKYSVKLCRCILCGDAAACRETACVLFVVQTDTKNETCRSDNYVYSSVKLIFSKCNKSAIVGE